MMTALAGLTQMDVLTELVKASKDEALHCLTLDDLAERINSPRRVIVKRMQALMYNKFAQSVRVGCYAATPLGHKRQFEGGEIKSGPKLGSKVNCRAPGRSALRARLWRALRTLRRATVSDLLQVAAKPDETNARDSAWRLLSQLNRAGYVTKLPRRSVPTRDCSNGEVIYFLLNNTGPLPPMETTDKETGMRGLKDRNTSEFIPYTETQARPVAVRAAQ